ncbi:MAG: hypothetical protein ACRYGP_20530 [Janthinobacterium lividum]
MILFNDDTLFVHNPKTAGTSLLSFFQTALPGPVRTAGVKELGTHHPSLSMAIGYACGVTGQSSFDRVLTVIRNPWDREVSMYVYFRDVLSTSPALAENLPDPAMRHRVQKAAELSFKSYLRWLWKTEGTVDVWNSRFFYQPVEGGRSEALHVLRFEHLKRDLDRCLSARAASVPKMNVSDRGPTASYYDKRTADLVRRSYRWMFDAGHYDSAAEPQRLRNITVAAKGRSSFIAGEKNSRS